MHIKALFLLKMFLLYRTVLCYCTVTLVSVLDILYCGYTFVFLKL